MSDDGLLDEARALQPSTVELRRRVHRHPEVGLQLPRTQQTILEEIADLGLEVSTGQSVTSVVALLEGGRPGPTVLLRADMDALPLQEETGLDFASEVDGAMHACGHDTHVAMLVSAARLLAARRRDLAGRVVLMFQPGEEGHHGARFMLEEGLLDEAAYAAPVGAAFALHISTQYPVSTINLRPGTLLASADRVRITVRGRGGHASAPHHALDPVPVACEIVQAFQTMITRQVSVFDPAVLTIARITAGTTHNVIPDTAEMLGTLRALSKQTREAVRAHIVRVAEGVAAAHGASVQVELESGYPMTVNDPAAAEVARAVAGDLIGEDAVNVLSEPIMGAEDFSYLLQRVPGAMAFLGACPPELDPETAPSNHSSRVVFDEDALPVGVATYAALALRELARPAAG